MTLPSPTTPPSTEAKPIVWLGVKSVLFSVTAPSGTAAMTWSLDGSTQTTAPKLQSGTEWTFEWPIEALSDGTYKIAAQAIESTGVVGPPVSSSVTLIRGTPAAPKGLFGGFNSINVGGKYQPVVELQWKANTERNVIGYRVYSPEGSLVCPALATTLSTSLSCIDFKPPATTALNLTYMVGALYNDKNGVIQESPKSSFTVTGGATAPAGPSVPKTLAATKNADGSVTLTWTVESTTGVLFYRIYRGSTEYTSRYDATASGTTLTYTDTDAVTTHTYWVTAVNGNLTESSPIGPVTA
jgi:hypothetical protein